MLHEKISRWFSGKNNRSHKGSQNKGVQKRHLRLEALEERALLAVSVGEFNQIREMYPDLNLSANMTDYTVIEVTAANLSEQFLRNSINLAAITTKSDLIVVRTTTTQNTITLSGTALAINIDATTNGSVTIVSFGEEKLTIDADGQSQVFNIQDSTVALAGLTITGGKDVIGDGGGIYSSNSILTITDCTISGNTATWGGGINCTGMNPTLTITNSIISGNSALLVGGGIFCGGMNSTLTMTDSIISGNSAHYGSGGGIYSYTSTLTNCTISDNTASYVGGGIYCGTLTLTDCTISGNIADEAGGGIYGTGTSSTLTITGSTISGNTVDGCGGGGIYSKGTLTITDSTISGNDSHWGGGGIYNEGTLTVTDSTIAENASDVGGGIYNEGTLTVMSSTISGNEAYDGGGIGNAEGTLTLMNSTISGNTADGFGGGIDNNYGTLTLTNCTVTDNTAYFGGGIFSNFTTTLYNTIVAKNTAFLADDVYSMFFNIAGANNLIGVGTGAAGLTDGVSGNIIGTTSDPIDPRLGPLQEIGNGKPKAHLLFSDSPAIDAGSDLKAVDASNNPLLYDQRGEARICSLSVDIGAVEWQGGDDVVTFTVTTLDDVVNPNDGLLSLREAIELANESPGRQRITFAPGLTGTIMLNGQQLEITNNVSIVGLGANKLTIDAHQQSRVFYINNNINVELVGLTITGGASSTGGGICNEGTLEIIDCTILDNHASSWGGGIYSGGFYSDGTTPKVGNSTLTLKGCTITENTADGGGGNGGGICSFDEKLTITDSTISGNTARFGGGISSGDSTLMNCTISGNQATESNGGGIYNVSTLTLTNCTISGNTAKHGGGGIFNAGGNNGATLTNCTVTNNKATLASGGGIGGGTNSGATLTNCTVTNNKAASSGGIGGDTKTLYNTIVVNNTAPYTPDVGSHNGDSNLTGSYLSLFVDAEHGDYRLVFDLNSPAIDKGNNQYAFIAGLDENSLDMAGNPRFSGTIDIVSNKPTIDIGAYEYQEEMQMMSSPQSTLNNTAQMLVVSDETTMSFPVIESQIRWDARQKPLAGFPGLPTNDSEYFVTKLEKRTTSLANLNDVIFALEEVESATPDLHAFSSDTKTDKLNLTLTESVDLDFVTAMFAQRQFHSRKMRI